ncbi:MAG: hypothetical protein KatS3mg015_2819 [Fimbriimonadales bacterium]|nr:MAG: hypothetical protein KatS3mg015_2819 [Fimbriimonadales bacterium]
MNDNDHVTNRELALELKSLKSEVRLWIIAAVGLNAFLAKVELPNEVSVPAIAAAILAPLAKSLFALIARW